MNIVYVYADSEEEWNCAEWRCAIPSRAINRSKGNSAQMISITDFSINTPDANAICSGADLIVIQRNLFGRVLVMIQHWQALDKTVIVDFDDAYNLMHPSVKNYKFWIEGLLEKKAPDGTIIEEELKPVPLSQFKWGLRLVHGSTVPCRILSEDWCKYSHTYIVPNFLELSKYVSVQSIPAHEEIVIGWGGSLSHLQSFVDSGVLTALKSVCRKRPKVRALICGDKRVFDQIDLPSEQKIFNQYVPPSEWPRMLAWFDIGIAPLHGEYDKRRSWIKILEYMAMKIPWIASDYPPYEDIRQFGKVVNNTAEEWERALLDVVDHYKEYKNSSKKIAYQFATQQNIDNNINRIIEIYATIINKSH